MRRLLIIVLTTAIVLLPGRSVWAGDLRVLLVLSDNTSPYQSFAKVLEQSLPASVRLVRQMPAGEESSTATAADLTVAVGMKAMESALVNSDMPIMGVMLHKTGYEALLEKTSQQKRSRQTSAIYLNHSWERQADFIRAALPKARKVGLLYSPDIPLELAGLRESLADKGLTLIPQPVRSAERLFYSLDELLGRADVLLSIPDSVIYNASNLRNILLTSYRHKVPLIGISQGYVNAGALGAIFSTPEQLAEQTAATVLYFAGNKRLPEPQYPAMFSIALNAQVARSLGIELPAPETIRERMGKAGEGRK